MWLFLLLVTLQLLSIITAIVNPNQESANVVIYLQKPVELGPRTWQAGVQCLDQFSRIYFQRRDHLTRSYNMMLTMAFNMSSPAAQIQEGYLKLINEIVSTKEKPHNLFQLRVTSDARPFQRLSLGEGELFLADFYVLVVDEVYRVQELTQKYLSRQSGWNPGGRFLVLFNNIEQRDEEQANTREIFDIMLRHFYVHNVAVLYSTGNSRYSFWVMDYYNERACRTMRLRRIGACLNGSPYPDIMTVASAMDTFLDKISLNNCTFFMCGSISAPFVESDCVAGIELRIVAFIKNRFQFDINQTCMVENRGVLTHDGLWTGLLGELMDRHCDFIVGGFYPDNDVAAAFWPSDSYLSDAHTWYIKVAEPRPAWRALYSIFQRETWICFVLVLLLSWICWYFFVNMLPEPRSHKDFSLAGLNSLGVSISAAVYERPLHISSRIFFLALTLYGLNVVSTYTSKLIAVFTDPGYLHQIDNLNEVIEAEIPFGGYEESRDWFENDDDMWIFNLYNDSSMFEPVSENLMAVKQGQRVILCSRMFILQHNISDDVFAFPTNVFSSPLQMIMKSGFPFVKEFNWMIRQMRDAGIMSKIDRDFYYNNTYLNRIAKMRPDFKESAIVLTTDHLQGPFAILVVGSVTSMALFLGELLCYWCLAPYVNERYGWQWRSRYARRSHKEAEKARLKKAAKNERIGKHGSKENCKKNKLKHKAASKNADKSELDSYDVNIIRAIRFTPLKRRHVVLK